MCIFFGFFFFGFFVESFAFFTQFSTCVLYFHNYYTLSLYILGALPKLHLHCKPRFHRRLSFFINSPQILYMFLTLFCSCLSMSMSLRSISSSYTKVCFVCLLSSYFTADPGSDFSLFVLDMFSFLPGRQLICYSVLVYLVYG